MIAEDLKESIDDIEYLCAGINHMSFYQKLLKLVQVKTSSKT